METSYFILFIYFFKIFILCNSKLYAWLPYLDPFPCRKSKIDVIGLYMKNAKPITLYIGVPHFLSMFIKVVE